MPARKLSNRQILKSGVPSNSREQLHSRPHPDPPVVDPNLMGSTFTGGYQSSRHQVRHVAEVGTNQAVLVGSDQTDIVIHKHTLESGPILWELTLVRRPTVVFGHRPMDAQDLLHFVRRWERFATTHVCRSMRRNRRHLT